MYGLITALAAVENVFPPVPADAAVALGGFLAGRGVLDVWFVFGLTWAANVGSGAAGALLSLVGLPDGLPSVGASGAIFGLMGASAYVIFRHAKRLYVRDKRVGIVILFWAAYTIAVGFLSPFVDNRAHIGGFVGGVAIAACLHPVLLEKERPLSPGSWGAFAATCLALAATFYFWAPRLIG